MSHCLILNVLVITSSDPPNSGYSSKTHCSCRVYYIPNPKSLYFNESYNRISKYVYYICISCKVLKAKIRVIQVSMCPLWIKLAIRLKMFATCLITLSLSSNRQSNNNPEGTSGSADYPKTASKKAGSRRSRRGAAEKRKQQIRDGALSSEKNQDREKREEDKENSKRKAFDADFPHIDESASGKFKFVMKLPQHLKITFYFNIILCIIL